MNLDVNTTKTLGNGQPEKEMETDMDRQRSDSNEVYKKLLLDRLSRPKPDSEEPNPDSAKSILTLIHAIVLNSPESGPEKDAVLDTLNSGDEIGEECLLHLKELAGCHIPGASKKYRIIKHNGIAVRLVMPDVPTAGQVRAEKGLATAIYPQGEGDTNKIIKGLSPADRSDYETALEKEDWKTADDIVSLSLKAAKYAREKAAAKAKTIRVRRAVRFVPIRNRARAQVRRAPRSVKHAAKVSAAASSPGDSSGDSSGGGEPSSSDPDLPRPHDRRLTPSAVPFRDGVSQVSFNDKLILHAKMAACELSALLSAHVLSQIVGGCSR